MSNWPYFAEDEINAVVEVLKSGKVNYWTGNKVKEFEKEFATFIGARYAIALANGTLALELALYALDIGPGDEVIVPSKTFMATASSVIMRGATPIIADVDLISQNLTVETIKAAFSEKTRAIIPVHLAGWPCAMDEIMEFANQHGLYVIEDCAQAHGAKYKGKYTGSWGHMAAFSFCQDKIMTTGGEGGMLLTDDENLWKKAWAFKDHGKDYDVVFHKEHPPGFRWLHESFGTNWRMTEMQAAIGLLQLEKLPSWLQTRRHYMKIFNQALKDIPFIRIAEAPQNIEHAAYKYYFFLRPEKLPAGITKDIIMQKINESGIPCFTGSCSEIYLENCFQKSGFSVPDVLPNARQLTETSLMLLIHPTLTEKTVRQQASMLKEMLHKFY